MCHNIAFTLLYLKSEFFFFCLKNVFNEIRTHEFRTEYTDSLKLKYSFRAFDIQMKQV